MNWPELISKMLFWCPWIGMAALIVFFLILAIFWRIYPTKGWLWLLGVQTLFLSTSIFAPKVMWLVIAIDAEILFIGLCDLMSLGGGKNVSIERQMIKSASLGGTHNVKLIIENRNRHAIRLHIKDGVPPHLVAEPEIDKNKIAPRKRLEFDYKLTPKRRGIFRFQSVYLRFQSLLGLWQRTVSRDCPAQLSVYPDMKQLAEYALLAKTNRLSLIGVRKTRRLGQDNNFERLRDYTQDDNYKHIDWRSTARRNKLTVKQFQADQSQRLIFMLDCGRLMTSEYKGLSLLDYALNSILMLSYVALQQRDSVGLLCFSDRVESYVPIRGGDSQMSRILHAGFDRFPSLRQTNFDQAFLHFSKHCRKRSLVVLVTTIIDDITAAQITGYLTNLIGRHLPLLCLLRDRTVFDYADNPDLEPSVLYRSAAAAQLLIWRHEVIQRMQNAGVLQVDAFPDTLTTPLVNRYLEVKAKHLL